MFKISKVKPNSLCRTQIEEILKIHTSFFNVSKEKITENLMNKDYVYLLIYKKTKQIVGTIGIKTYITDNTHLVYLGLAAINKNFMHNGFMHEVTRKEAIQSLIKSPLKSKYLVGLITTPLIYNVSRNFSESYPRGNIKTPPEIKQLMFNIVPKLFPNEDYEWKDGACILKNLRKENFHIVNSDLKISSYDGYFETVNPDYINGDQLLMVFKINIRSFTESMWCSLRNKTKKVIDKLKAQTKQNAL